MNSSNKHYSRRRFLKQQAAGLGGLLALGLTPPVFAGSKEGFALPSPGMPLIHTSRTGTPAILGGAPVRAGSWPSWPMWNPATDEERVIKVLRSGVWSRAGVVDEFEAKWAATVGAKRCLAVVNGTNSLIVALTQLGIGGGDEVIVPPYTFIASVAAVLATGAIPVFVDTDRETFQIDTRKIEAKITPRTKAILPVHILGLPANMPEIMRIARKHNLVVVEDACQAWLAEIDNKKTGTFGNAGCFSFQNSKNIPIGEGGAVVSDDDEFMDRCYSYHNLGLPYGAMVGTVGTGSVMLGTKLRLTEYQAAIGLAQLERLEGQTELRNANATYLTSLISEVPGIIPYKLYDNVTRAAFHLFPFRYKKEGFKGLSRDAFLKALRAEGIPCSSGYTPLNDQPYLEHAFQTKNYQKMYSKEELDIQAWKARNQCPENDILCNEEAVWIPQNVLLGSKQDMTDIAAAIEKIQAGAERILKEGK